MPSFSKTFPAGPAGRSLSHARQQADDPGPQLGTSKSAVGASLQGMVDDFLLSLPLGTSAQDAAVEDRVAQRLLQLHKEKQALEDKLGEW